MNGLPFKRPKGLQSQDALSGIAKLALAAIPLQTELRFKCIAASCNPRALASKEIGYHENPLQRLLVGNDNTFFLIELRGWSAIDAFAEVNPHGKSFDELKTFRLKLKLPDSSLQFHAHGAWDGKDDPACASYITISGTGDWSLEETKQTVDVDCTALPHATLRKCFNHPDGRHNVTIRFDVNAYLVTHSQPNRPEPGMAVDERGTHLPIRFFCHPSIPSKATASLYGVRTTEWGGLLSLAFDTDETLYGPAPDPDAIPALDVNNHKLKLPVRVVPFSGVSRGSGWVKAVIIDITLDELGYVACTMCHKACGRDVFFLTCGHGETGRFVNAKLNFYLKDCATGRQLPAVAFGSMANRVLGLPLDVEIWESKKMVRQQVQKIVAAAEPKVFQVVRNTWQGSTNLIIHEVEDVQDVLAI